MNFKLHLLFSNSEITKNSTISGEEVSGNKKFSRSGPEEVAAIKITS